MLFGGMFTKYNFIKTLGDFCWGVTPTS